MKHSRDALHCLACNTGTTFDQIMIGARVRVPHRQNAVGVVDRLYSDTEPELVGIRFGRGFGLNYPHQIELILDEENKS